MPASRDVSPLVCRACCWPAARASRRRRVDATAGVAPPAARSAAGRRRPPGRPRPTRATPRSLAAWWQRFGDPALTALIARGAGRQHRRRRRAGARCARRARWRERRSRPGSARASTPPARRSAAARTARSAGNSFRAGFDASWEPDLFGGNARRRATPPRPTRRPAPPAWATCRCRWPPRSRWPTCTLRGSEARLAIAQRQPGQPAGDAADHAVARAGRPGDLARRRSRRAPPSSRRARRCPSLQTAIAQSRHQLALLTGAHRARCCRARRGGAAAAAAPADLALSFPAETLRQRADVRAAELQRAAPPRSASCRPTRRATRASTLSGSLGLQRADAVRPDRRRRAWPARCWPACRVPLFDGGAAKAQVRAQQAALDQARAALPRHRAGRAEGRGGRARRAARATASAWPALQQRRRGGRQRRAAGAPALRAAAWSTSRPCSRRSARCSRAQDSVASSRADVATDHVRLYKALGGGWTARRRSPTTRPTEHAHEPHRIPSPPTRAADIAALLDEPAARPLWKRPAAVGRRRCCSPPRSPARWAWQSGAPRRGGAELRHRAGARAARSASPSAPTARCSRPAR